MEFLTNKLEKYLNLMQAMTLTTKSKTTKLLLEFVLKNFDNLWTLDRQQWASALGISKPSLDYYFYRSKLITIKDLLFYSRLAYEINLEKKDNTNDQN